MPDTPLPHDPTASIEQREWLGQVRMALLRLHKQLLDAEKVRYERTQGRIEGGMAFLRLATTDPWFAWIRPLSSLIVEIDDALDAEAPMSSADVHAYRDRIRAFVAIDPEGSPHHQEYDDAVQATPEVLIAHVSLVRLLQREP
jgi:hypothetical protein